MTNTVPATLEDGPIGDVTATEAVVAFAQPYTDPNLAASVRNILADFNIAATLTMGTDGDGTPCVLVVVTTNAYRDAADIALAQAAAEQQQTQQPVDPPATIDAIGDER